MEYFHHIKPLAVKSGEQVFLCTCCDAYQKYCCVESTALSLLYNVELEVPDIARLQQIKEQEKALLANPFNTKRIKDKKRKEDKKKEKAAPKWKPHIPVYASCTHGSAADMASQRGKITARAVMPAVAQVPRLPKTPCRGQWTPSSSSCPVPRDLLRIVSILRRPTNRRRRYIASMCYERLRVPATLHIPFLPSRQISSSQPLELEVVGAKRPSRTRAASQPETSRKSKKAKDTSR
jgi:hypothetical protein